MTEPQPQTSPPPATNPDNSQPNNAPPAQQPQQQQPRPVVVNSQPNQEVMTAINALPEKMASVFKEIFNPPQATAQQPQSTQQPQSMQQPAQQPAQQPTQQSTQQQPSRWNFGKWYLTGNGR
jgi:hypothetical protein